MGDYLLSKHIKEAYENISQTVHRTPLEQSTYLNDITGSEIFLKLENLQHTGSFKIRGALNKIAMLQPVEAAKGVIAASAGNHAQGVAYAANKRGIQATIFMPESTPHAKVHATEGYGAKVMLIGESYQEAYEAACHAQLSTGASFVHAFDDREVMAGQGTIALEMMQQHEDIDTVVVPIGGGGLMAGIATYLKQVYPKVRIIGVQSMGAPSTYQRYKQQGSGILTKVSGIADGILVKEPGSYTYPIIEEYVDDIVTVTDEEIARSIIFMLERQKLFVEGAGASALASIMSNKIDVLHRKIGVIVSGGNADISKIQHFHELSQQRFNRTSFIQ